MTATKLRPDDKRLLVRITATLEATFSSYAFAGSNGRPWAAILERRQRYLAGDGLELMIGGDSTGRQRGYQALKRLEEQGIVGLHKSGVHRTGVSILNWGVALSLTPNYSLDEIWPTLGRLAAMHDDPATVHNAGFIVAHDLLGLDRESTDGAPLQQWESRNWPLAALGLIESSSDASGLVGWRLTSEGQAAAKRKPPAQGKVGYARDLFGAYQRILQMALDSREQWKPSASCVGVPLSAGAWGAASDE